MKLADHDQFMKAWRASRHVNGTKIVQAEYDLIMAAIAGTWSPDRGVANANEVPWLSVARSLIGQKEIHGPKHNSWIAKGWARLGAGWYNDDETPWCGFFMAHCMDAVKIPYPSKGLFARAKAWMDWGKNCRPTLGAVVVFGRQGGGHVGLLVGESNDSWYVLGGNQKHAVNIMPILKSRALGYRWPASHPLKNTPLPRMTGGIVSTNEA